MVVEVILTVLTGIGLLCAVGVVLQYAIRPSSLRVNHTGMSHEVAGEVLLRKSVKARSHEECEKLRRSAYAEFVAYDLEINGPYKVK